MKRLHDEHVKETSEGNTPIHPVQRSRQRRNQPFEGLEENNYQIDAQTGWRTYPSNLQGNLSRNPAHSSSSTQWEQHDDWKSNKSWNSWRSSSWTEQQCFFFLFRVAFPLVGKRIPWQSTGRCRQIHLPHATFSHVQSLHRSHSTDDMCAWLKGLRAPDELRANSGSFIHASCLALCASQLTERQHKFSLHLFCVTVVLFSEPRPVVHLSDYPL